MPDKPAAPPGQPPAQPAAPTPIPREPSRSTSGESLPIQQQNEWSSQKGPGPATHVGPDDPKSGTVHLPGLISDEFGISQPTALDYIERGEVLIDGEPYSGRDRVNLPVDQIDGKTILVKGRDRSFSVRYRLDDHRE